LPSISVNLLLYYIIPYNTIYCNIAHVIYCNIPPHLEMIRV
jgi:hypothetical protein